MEVSAADIALYVEIVSGKKPVPDTQGQIRLRCVVKSTPEHCVVMTLGTGDWYCEQGCGRGDLADYEEWRSKAFGFRQGESNIRRILEDAKSKAFEPEQAVRVVQIKAPRELDPYALRVLAHIARHPGQSRRYHQQTAHLKASRV